MYIKIYNKNNLIDDTLSIDHLYEESNLKPFTIDENSLFTECYNETLDSANIRLSHLEQRLDIEPLDRVKIYGDSRIGTKYMCVDTYTMKEETLNQENYTQKFYTYEISLFSETKLLEGAILPNLSITNATNNIAFYIQRYMNLYCPKERQYYTKGYEVAAYVAPESTSWTATITDTDLIGKTIKSKSATSNPESLSVRISVNTTTGQITIIGRVVSSEMARTYRVEADVEFLTERPSITVGSNITTKFTNITPEFQWNAPTLREVINDLMMTQDCIPVVNNKTLSYIDLSETKGDISSMSDTINYIQWSQSSDDYISELKMNLQNVMQTSISGLSTTTSTTEYIPFTSEDYVLTSDNLELETQFPILNIKHLYYCFVISAEAGSGGTGEKDSRFIKVDLCNIENMRNTNTTNLVVEAKEYQILETLYKSDTTPITVYDYRNSKDIDNYYSKYKNFHLYFTRNSNKIQGFSSLQKTVLGGQHPTWEWLRCFAIANQIQHGVPNQMAYALTLNDVYGTLYPMGFFQVEYETMTDAIIQAGKSDYGANKKIVVDNQTNSWVDAYNQGNLEYQKANRLGNKAILINQRSTGTQPLIQIGQTYYNSDTDETYIIYQTQYQTHSDHIEVNCFAVENYVMRDYYTGINSKIRTWVNAQDEALVRHELDKYYLEFSKTKHSEIGLGSGESNILDRYANPLTTTSMNSINYALVKTTTSTKEFPENTYFINGKETKFDYPSITAGSSSVSGTTNITELIGETVVKKELTTSTTSGLVIANYTINFDSTTGDVSYSITFTSTAPTTQTVNVFLTLYYGENRTDSFSLNEITRLVGNSIVHTFGFNDNATSGKGIDTDIMNIFEFKSPEWNGQPAFKKQDDDYGGIPLKDYFYCDNESNFDFEKMKVRLQDQLVITDGTYTVPDNRAVFDDNDEMKNFLVRCCERPLIAQDIQPSAVFEKEYTLYKDNREIPKMSIQFELCRDNQDIYFTKGYMKNLPDIRQAKTTPKFYLSDTYKENAESITTLTYTDITSNMSAVLSQANNRIRLQANTALSFNNKVIYIGSSPSDIWLGINVGNNYTNYVDIYMNVLKDRNKNIYNSSGIIVNKI